jgi:hypothetical protein
MSGKNGAVILSKQSRIRHQVDAVNLTARLKSIQDINDDLASQPGLSACKPYCPTPIPCLQGVRHSVSNDQKLFVGKLPNGVIRRMVAVPAPPIAPFRDMPLEVKFAVHGCFIEFIEYRFSFIRRIHDDKPFKRNSLCGEQKIRWYHITRVTTFQVRNDAPQQAPDAVSILSRNDADAYAGSGRHSRTWAVNLGSMEVESAAPVGLVHDLQHEIPRNSG